jgi:hypothetical protein
MHTLEHITHLSQISWPGRRTHLLLALEQVTHEPDRASAPSLGDVVRSTLGVMALLKQRQTCKTSKSFHHVEVPNDTRMRRAMVLMMQKDTLQKIKVRRYGEWIPVWYLRDLNSVSRHEVPYLFKSFSCTPPYRSPATGNISAAFCRSAIS